jgi:hypothetical protein
VPAPRRTVLDAGRAPPFGARFGEPIHARRCASSPPTSASSERKQRTGSAAISPSLRAGSIAWVPAASRDTLASLTPSVAASRAPRRSSSSAARSVARVSTRDRAAASTSGRTPAPACTRDVDLMVHLAPDDLRMEFRRSFLSGARPGPTSTGRDADPPRRRTHAEPVGLAPRIDRETGRP